MQLHYQIIFYPFCHFTGSLFLHAGHKEFWRAGGDEITKDCLCISSDFQFFLAKYCVIPGKHESQLVQGLVNRMADRVLLTSVLVT